VNNCGVRRGGLLFYVEIASLPPSLKLRSDKSLAMTVGGGNDRMGMDASNFIIGGHKIGKDTHTGKWYVSGGGADGRGVIGGF